MVYGPGGLNELFGPRYRLEILDTRAEVRRVCRDGGGHVEIALVGGPPKGGTQVGELNGEPITRAARLSTAPK